MRHTSLPLSQGLDPRTPISCAGVLLTRTHLSTALQATMVASRSPVWPTMSGFGKLSRTCTHPQRSEKLSATTNNLSSAQTGDTGAAFPTNKA